jgi:hypothetical protein
LRKQNLTITLNGPGNGQGELGMTQERTQTVRDTATETFLREAEGWQVDHPLTRKQTADASSGSGFIDDRFAPLANDRPLRLRRALTTFVNKNARDKEVSDILRIGGVHDDSEGPSGACIFHVTETGAELRVQIEHFDGSDGWTGKVNGQRYHAPTRDGLLSLISRELNNNVRNLTGAELREISILCQTPGQGFYSGVARYVAKKTGRPESEALTDAAVLDNRTAGVYDEAVNFCFLAIHGDFSPGPEWNDWLAQYARGRHYNFALLEGAKTEYQRQLEESARQALLSIGTDTTQAEEPPTYNELDQLNDDELSGQFTSVKRERAKMIRAGTY